MAAEAAGGRLDMSMLNDLGALIVQAMKAHDQTRLSSLRMLKTALTNKEVEKGRALEPSEELQVVSTSVKQRRESIEQFQAGGRTDLVDKELAELRVIETFLPPPVDDAALEAIARAAIGETGATSVKDLGRVMKALMPRLAGQTVDGGHVRQIVQRLLEQPGPGGRPS
jgi:uncharacterized protein YqeY